MVSNRELLEKVVSTTAIGAGNGGIMNAKQANRFLDYVVNQSVLIADARMVRMVENTQDIDKVSIGTRILRKATEGVDDGVNADATFTKISLTTTKLRLDWELTTEGLEDNIERNSLEDHVASMMATQTSNDLEDLLINGDTTSTDPLLKSFDGWRKYARTNGRVVDAAGANLSRAVFDRALRNLPTKYLQQRSKLKWYTSSGLLQDYLWSLMASTLTDAGTFSAAAAGGGTLAAGAPYMSQGTDNVLGGANGGNGGANGATGLRPFGIPLWEVPFMSEGDTATYSAAAGGHGNLDLTFPQNRIVGILRDIQVFREFKPKKDAIEYTQFIRVGCQIENGDAFVTVKNIKPRSL